MTFISFSFLVFLPVSYLLFLLASDRWRWLVLLAASYGFYASWKTPYLLVALAGVTCISYLCALRMAGAREEGQRKLWLCVGVFFCLAVLAMKYLLLPPGLWADAAGAAGSATLVTVGVSYFSFQAVSYLADVYLEVEEAETHFGHFALYLAFFPKLLQGPIERAADLLPQLGAPQRFDYDRMRGALLLFSQGLFKKMVVADRLGLYVDAVYGNVHHHSAPTLLIASYLYALQIYFDFSSYTDMARGAGRIFGIELTENFNSPYLATSVAEFWRRWHISFSRWILDYIFKPLQFAWRESGQHGSAAALMVTFLVSGLWHGASWPFLAWGTLHGIYLAGSTYYRPYQKKLHRRLGVEKSRWLKVWQRCITFHLVTFAWIFFRSDTLQDAWHVVRSIFHARSLVGEVVTLGGQGELWNLLVGMSRAQLIILVPSLCVAVMMGRLHTVSLPARPACLRLAYYQCLLAAIALLKVQQSSFIYFKF